jgi:hypothetical protein
LLGSGNEAVGRNLRYWARFGGLGLTRTLEVRQATEEENMYNSYLILIEADQRRRQRKADAAAYRQAQATSGCGCGGTQTGR